MRRGRKGAIREGNSERAGAEEEEDDMDAYLEGYEAPTADDEA